MPACKILEGIVYLLPTGYQWKALPKEGLASSSAIDTHLLRWAENGFLLLFGQQNWLNMMKWRPSPGNGQASTEALSKLPWLQKQSVRIQSIGKKEAWLQIEKIGGRSQSLLVQPVQENPGRR